ncbi:MAG: hypothetical protein ACTSPI_12465 [Candidatus Heimdallarchaeaceae archaeon]
MKPTGQSLITKGIQAIEKGISLITKGILDRARIRKGAQQLVKKFFKIIFPLYGIKQFKFSMEYSIIGKKVVGLMQIFELVGRKSILSRRQLLIGGIISRAYNKKYCLRAKRQHLFDVSLVLAARKKYNITDNRKVVGILRSRFQNKRDFVVRGIRKIDFKTDMTVKGKRDIIPLLLAAGLLDKEEKV